MATIENTSRVLIVDDYRDGADALGLLLEELDNLVRVTYSGVQALDEAHAFRPDLILVDLHMPGMDGCTLVSRFRQLPAISEVIIVAITGQKTDEYKTRAIDAGCDLLLHKPVTLTAVRMILANILPKSASTAFATAPRLPAQAVHQG